jgi:hypothetical protein
MFKTACGMREVGGWEISPSEFWSMSPVDWWLLYDMNVGFRIAEDRDTMARLKRLFDQSKAQEASA